MCGDLKINFYLGARNRITFVRSINTLTGMTQDSTLTVLDEDTLQPEEAEKQKVNSNAVLPKLASCMAQVDTAEDSSERLPLRLVQLQPAWALHLMLRFRGLSYHCENSRLPYSLGHALPLLVDGHYLWEEQDALGHLSHLCGVAGGSGDGQQRGSALDSPPTSSSSSSLISDSTHASPTRLQAWVRCELRAPLHRLRQQSGDGRREVLAVVGGAASPMGIFLQVQELMRSAQQAVLAGMKRLPLPKSLRQMLDSDASGGARSGRSAPDTTGKAEAGADATPSADLRRQQKAVDAYIDANTKPDAPGSVEAVAATMMLGQEALYAPAPVPAATAVSPTLPRAPAAASNPRPFPSLDSPVGSLLHPQLAPADLQQLQTALRELDSQLERDGGMLPETVRSSCAEAELCEALLLCVSCPVGRAAVDMASHKHVQLYLQAMCKQWFQAPTGTGTGTGAAAAAAAAAGAGAGGHAAAGEWAQATLQLLDNPLVDASLHALLVPDLTPPSELQTFAASTPMELDSTPAALCSVWLRQPVMHSPLMRLYRWMYKLPLPAAEPAMPADPWLSEISPFGVVTLASTALSFACYALMTAGWAGIPTNMRLPELHLLLPTLRKAH